MLEEQKGDLLKCEGPIAHCVGADMIMGAGVALAIRNKYMSPESLTILRSRKWEVGKCVASLTGGKLIYNIVTKPVSRNCKPTQADFELAMVAWRDALILDMIKLCNIPLLGCGLDGLNWDDFVRPTIEKVFAGTDIKIVLWTL